MQVRVAGHCFTITETQTLTKMLTLGLQGHSQGGSGVLMSPPL